MKSVLPAEPKKAKVESPPKVISGPRALNDPARYIRVVWMRACVWTQSSIAFIASTFGSVWVSLAELYELTTIQPCRSAPPANRRRASGARPRGSSTNNTGAGCADA
ncbi:MAG: hypothetical protein HOQ17_13365 [Gemmatimonadaceae bacterium]|nr:hypothetical protein [Gemmatimonadaceae bacterium]NUS34039.1 hypothetical protein [Gemmatimonadaceae bacterium]NUS46078.1 hypothetical protein [Gemmatimonadaceae bacterium]